MALIPTLVFHQSPDCKQLQVIDNTGIYDAVDNLGGWGAPNVLLADVTAAVIKVLLPKGAVGSEITIDLEPQIPNNNFNFKILRSQDFGLKADTLLPDGTYIIDYEVTNSVGPVTDKFHTEITLVCQKLKCVNKILAKIAATGCDCDKSTRELATEVQMVMASMRHAAECQRPSEVDKIAILLDKLCKQIDNCLTCV